LAADGSPAGGEFLVNTYTDSSQDSPSVAIDGAGNFTIVWHSRAQDAGANGGINCQRYLAGGESWSANVTISWPEADPFGTDAEYFVVIQLDYPGDIEEGNESNNVLISEPLALVTPMPLDIQLASHLGGASEAVAIQGDYAYEISTAGLRVPDIRDPANILKLAEMVFPVEMAVAVHAEADRLYEVDTRAIRVFDISSPHQPGLLAEQAVGPGARTAVAFEGDVALVGDAAESQLDIVDLSDPANPD
jgi:hypothetical protein